MTTYGVAISRGEGATLFLVVIAETPNGALARAISYADDCMIPVEVATVGSIEDLLTSQYAGVGVLSTEAV